MLHFRASDITAAYYLLHFRASYATKPYYLLHFKASDMIAAYYLGGTVRDDRDSFHSLMFSMISFNMFQIKTSYNIQIFDSPSFLSPFYSAHTFSTPRDSFTNGMQNITAILLEH